MNDANQWDFDARLQDSLNRASVPPNIEHPDISAPMFSSQRISNVSPTSAVSTLTEESMVYDSLPLTPPRDCTTPMPLTQSIGTVAPVPSRYPGVYSSSGFDLMGMLARVLTRPNPAIDIGPVDASCSFVVVDALKPDEPIIYASETFSQLTGYTNEEITGRNCRFLQAPHGKLIKGGQRKYTDNDAVVHLRIQLDHSKETQVGLLNFRKTGESFVNLVTIIPVSYNNTGLVTHFVGFQVALSDLPNPLLDRALMSNTVDYTLQATLKNGSNVFALPAPADAEWDDYIAEASKAPNVTVDDSKSLNPSDILDFVINGRYDSLDTEQQHVFHTTMLDQVDDLVYVLSLRGTILYCSPSAHHILEYSPQELVGLNFKNLIHPSDVVQVLKDLKDAGNVGAPNLNVAFRVQRQHSGYLWIEAIGKLYVEPGKGRKSMIINARCKSIPSMVWSDVRRNGVVSTSEMWIKASSQGQILSCTKPPTIFASSNDELVGQSLFSLVRPADIGNIREALLAALEGNTRGVQHAFYGIAGTVNVSSYFHARHSMGDSYVLGSLVVENHPCVIVQINMIRAPAQQATPPSPVANSFDAVYPIVKPPGKSNNVFEELECIRCTSWVWEYHQLQLRNQKLMEEKEKLMSILSSKTQPVQA